VNDQEFMKLALEEAEAALEHGDVPIGAVAVAGDEVIARAHNQRESQNDATAHAEVLALREASQALGRWRLDDVTLYVTVEPCPMCAGALVLARIDRVVYGAADEKWGSAYTLYNIVQDPRLNHECKITAGVMAEECADILQRFFQNRRR
jgi:tRNA(adenine34) deaminase